MNYVPPAARFLALAIVHDGNPKRGLTEAQMVERCGLMRAAGVHDYDLGANSNLRNRIQRNWAGSSIWKKTWREAGYRPVFERVEGSRPTRWRVNDEYAEELRKELGRGPGRGARPQQPRLI